MILLFYTANDAIEIDNSNMSLEEQFDKILELVKMVLEDYK
jgi:cytidylate kinase